MRKECGSGSPAGGEGWGRPQWKVPGVTGAFRGARPRATHGDAGGKRWAAETQAAQSHPEDEDTSLARKPGGKEAGTTGWRQVPSHLRGRPGGWVGESQRRGSQGWGAFAGGGAGGISAKGADRETPDRLWRVEGRPPRWWQGLLRTGWFLGRQTVYT